MAHDEHPLNTTPPGASRLGRGLILRGGISGNGPLVIEGETVGDIHLEQHDLVVEAGGKAQSEIFARNVIIRGDVEGNVIASERVDILETGRMKGDVTASMVSIAAGAQFRGSIRMNKARPI